MSGNVHRDVGKRRRKRVGRSRIALARGVYGLRKHLREQIETNSAHVARLFSTQNASRAANLQIAHGYAHAASQVLMLIERGQTRLGFLGQAYVLRKHEVRVRLHR